MPWCQRLLCNAHLLEKFAALSHHWRQVDAEISESQNCSSRSRQTWTEISIKQVSKKSRENSPPHITQLYLHFILSPSLERKRVAPPSLTNLRSSGPSAWSSSTWRHRPTIASAAYRRAHWAQQAGRAIAAVMGCRAVICSAVGVATIRSTYVAAGSATVSFIGAVRLSAISATRVSRSLPVNSRVAGKGRTCCQCECC